MTDQRNRIAQAIWDATRAQEPEEFMPTLMTDMGSCLRVADALIAAGVVAEEPEWEYSWAGTDDEGDDWVMDDAFDTRGAAVAYVTRPIGRWVNTDNGTLVRRRKAGPWVPVDEDGADQ